MTFPNHVAGGIVFTGFIGSIIGVNIFSSVALLSATLIGSVIPDIDTPNSIIGRIPIVSYVAKYINRKVGHRTLTHSLPFLFLVGIVVSMLNLKLAIDDLTVVVLVAMFSHILFDMMTVSGVVFLYPFSNSLFVVPGRAENRLRVRDFRSEFIVFCVFIVSFIFIKDLIFQGFWNTYNQSFGTQKHLLSSFNKSEHLIRADYVLRSGSISRSISGLVVDCDANGSTLYDDGNLVVVPEDREQIIDVTFEVTELEYFYKSIMIDSSSFKLMSDDMILVDIDSSANPIKATQIVIM